MEWVRADLDLTTPDPPGRVWLQLGSRGPARVFHHLRLNRKYVVMLSNGIDRKASLTGQYPVVSALMIQEVVTAEVPHPSPLTEVKVSDCAYNDRKITFSYTAVV